MNLWPDTPYQVPFMGLSDPQGLGDLSGIVAQTALLEEHRARICAILWNGESIGDVCYLHSA